MDKPKESDRRRWSERFLVQKNEYQLLSKEEFEEILQSEDMLIMDENVYNRTLKDMTATSPAPGVTKPEGEKEATTEIEYVSLAEYAKIWDVKIDTIRKNCNRGHMVSAKKDAADRWIVDKKEPPQKIKEIERVKNLCVPKHLMLSEESNQRLKACTAAEPGTSESEHVNNALEAYFKTRPYL